MVTIRAYLNVAEAELAKSLLDDYGILCAVAHENAHLYGGSPFAMPIQLLVEEERAGEAIRILDGTAEPATDIETPGLAAPSLSGVENQGVLAKDNPWELLVIAALFLLPGILGLWMKSPSLMASGPPAHGVIVAIMVFHFFSLIAIAFAACLIIAYLWLRWRVTVESRE